MGEIKQTNFRIDQASADAFRQFCEENGLSQAQGFDHIMQVVELDKAKVVTPDRRTEIETFEKSIKDIMKAYLYSLEISNNAEDRIKEQFSSALRRSGKTIDDLQQKVKKLQEDKTAAESGRAEAEKEKEAALERQKSAAAQMEAAKKATADQEQINSMVKQQLADATSKLEGYEALRWAENALREKNTELEHMLEKQKKDAESEARSAHAQAELDKERAVMEKEREMYERIRQTDRENAKLTAQIEQLQEKINELTKGHAEIGER